MKANFFNFFEKNALPLVLWTFAIYLIVRNIRLTVSPGKKSKEDAELSDYKNVLKQKPKIDDDVKKYQDYINKNLYKIAGNPKKSDAYLKDFAAKIVMLLKKYPTPDNEIKSMLLKVSLSDLIRANELYSPKPLKVSDWYVVGKKTGGVFGMLWGAIKSNISDEEDVYINSLIGLLSYYSEDVYKEYLSLYKKEIEQIYAFIKSFFNKYYNDKKALEALKNLFL